MLGWKWSPQQISATLKRVFPHQREFHVSHETIYTGSLPRIALERPDLVARLVLAVTSGGIDMKSLGVRNWREGFARAYSSLELREISQPILLVWGNADLFSTVAVDRKLLELLPSARRHVVPVATTN
jgi:hypothetical protein